MANLDEMRRQLEAKVQRVANRVAGEVERELERSAPVDSGLLRSLITTQVKATATGATIDITSNAPYAEFVRSHREKFEDVMRRLPDRIARAWRSTS